MINLDPRVKTLVRDNAGLRLHILFILWAAPAPAAVQDIADTINCSRKSVGDLLPRMEQDGYVARFGAGRHPRWSLTDKAQQLELPGLSFSSVSNGRNFPITSSSSSDLISSSGLKTDQISEEEESREESSPQERNAIADDYRLTGDYRTIVLTDPWITRRRFECWFNYAQDGKKRSPAAYAVQCCSRHDEPPEEGSNTSDSWDRVLQSRKFQRDIERYRSRPDAK